MSETVIQIHDIEIKKGTTVQGRYEITRHLGAGGFAQVFEAFDSNIERPVAIKFLNLHASTTNPDASDNILARFKREAKTAARIQHPNVVNIFDFGVLGKQRNIPFIVMELLSGHDLEEQIFEKGPMKPDRALPLFVDCLEALGEAHKLGIVHKDLKPSNLFLSNPGERTESLRIVDFGIAHIRDAREGRLTATGEILGTPQYLSPEYIEAQIVTPAFDVYQMALILVEALTGRPVVDESHPLRCVKVHSMGELDLPSPLLESPLGPVVARALHLNHNERYANAEEFADALAEIDPTSIPMLGPDTPTSRLTEAGTLDSNSRLINAGTGQMRRPSTGQLAGGVTQQGYAQPNLQGPADASDAMAGQPTAQHARNHQGTTNQVPRSTEAAIQEAGIGSGGVKMLVALGLAVLVLGGVAAWLLTAKLAGDEANAGEHAKAGVEAAAAAESAGEADAPDNTGPAAKDDTPGADDNAAGNLAQDDKPDKSDQAEEAAAAAAKPQPVEITVDSSPSGATVSRGGEKLGEAPVSVKFDSKDADAVSLELSRSGYKDKTVEVGPDAGEDFVVDLERKARPKRTHRTHSTRTREKKVTKKAEAPKEKSAPAKTEPKKTEPKKVEKKESESQRMLIAP